MVDKKTTTITLNNLLQVYNGSARTVSATTPELGTNGISVSYNGSDVAPTNAGSYAVTASLNNPHYTAEVASGTMVISKASATINVGALQHIYDGQEKPASISIDPTGITGLTVTYNGSSSVPVNAGEYEVVASLTNSNYEAEEVSRKLVIAKADQEISWANPQGIVYGTALSANQLNATLTSGDGGLAYSPATGAILAAGTHTLRVTAAGTSNYNPAAATVSLNVAKATPVLTLNVGGPYTYDGTSKVIASATLEGVLESDDLGAATITYSKEGTPVASPVEAGTYAVSATFEGNDNYTAAQATGSLLIRKANLVVKANDESRVYGNPNPTLTGDIISGAAAGDALTVTASTTATPASGVGQYPITVSVSGAMIANYTVEAQEGTLTVTPRPVTVAAYAAAKTYGDADPALRHQITSGSLVNNDTFSGALERETGEDAGEYAIRIGTLSLSGNYAMSFSGAVFTINAKQITVTPLANQYKVYGQDDPVLKYEHTALVGNDVFSGLLSREAGSNVGAYKILTGSLRLSSNYTLTFTEGVDFEIAPKQVTASIQAENKVYDGSVAATATGRVPAEELIAGDEVPVTVQNARFADKNVGVGKTVLADVSIGNPNYSLTAATATTSAAITPKPASVTPTANAKVYGTSDPILSGTLADFVAADGIVATYGREPGERVGSYGIRANLSPAAELGNYNITYHPATFEITPARLVVVADNASRAYGDENPALAGSMTGVVQGDDISAIYTTAATTKSAVGTYEIVPQVSGGAIANYTVETSKGTLTVTARAISVTADAKAKMFNQADPALTYQVTTGALVNGDAFSGSLARVAGETPGVYAINQGSLTAGTNYALSYNGASLTIYAIPTVSIENPAPVQYGSTVNVAAKYTGIVTAPKWVWGFTSDTNGSFSGESTITGSTTVPNLPGVYTLVLKYKNAVGDELTTEPVFISVFDPEGGFVTGGGWINSPSGALSTEPDATGKANFGFVAKYKKGKNEVEGNTEFQFQAGKLNFKSSVHNYGSLVISGAKATYKGKGYINGGTTEYDFMVVATDGQVSGGGDNDKFRIKIWNGGEVVYDNARGEAENAELGVATILGGGSIVIHENKPLAGGSSTKKVVAATETLEVEGARFHNYPNPYNDKTTISFTFEKEESFALEVFDAKGARVMKFAEGMAEAGKAYEYEFAAGNLPEGIYFARLATASGVKTIKMVLKR
nr:MBG domain-containing protein [Pontibacter litorisediminis]